MGYEKELRVVKLLQDRAPEIEAAHKEIAADISSLKESLAALVDIDKLKEDPEFIAQHQKIMAEMSVKRELKTTKFSELHKEAKAKYGDVTVDNILSEAEKEETNNRINLYIEDFNKQYGLDAWDYAIGVSCGLFAAMLDLLCVKAPLKPTVPFQQQVDGVFNRAVQDGFNRLVPPELTAQLSAENHIGAADISNKKFFLNAPLKVLSPMNHRLRELSHDPVLGFFFGVHDMMTGTCTVINDGTFMNLETAVEPVSDNSILALVVRMFKHLVSDVNAPSGNGNRGMGLPAPFMGLLRMFTFEVDGSTFDKQIEYMFVRGYDLRQFVTTSIPMTIMEVMLRVFYIAKQMRVYSAPFGETICNTMPGRIHPKFRTILALAYGTVASINAGKVCVTNNILNANYAAWLGFAWNTFHALRWALYKRELTLWNSIEQKELALIASYVDKIEALEARAELLPI